jgi:urate oxidase
MPAKLASNSYGKSAVRLTKVKRGPERHELVELEVAIHLTGDFADSYLTGDNRQVIATDTMKNTVYAMAAGGLVGAPESFGLAVAQHFGAYPQVERAAVAIREHDWSRIETAAGPAPDAFVRSGRATRLATVAAGRGGTSVEAGIEDLTVLKTTKSAFVGFERDRYTTLRDADDRIMATRITATWGYEAAAVEKGLDFDAAHARAVERLLTSFAEHTSASVQASIWIMAGAMLDADPAIAWVRMILPNLHHWSVDLTPFGVENRGEVFVATAEPHGVIDATVHRQP